jgi:hypothetical protein
MLAGALNRIIPGQRLHRRRAHPSAQKHGHVKIPFILARDGSNASSSGPRVNERGLVAANIWFPDRRWAVTPAVAPAK